MAKTPEELVPANSGASGRSVKNEAASPSLNEIGAYEVPFPSDRSRTVGNTENIKLSVNWGNIPISLKKLQ
jgi:hypothetical protein